MIYYTADTHFGDSRIIELCHRPFRSMTEMTDEIIRRWNSVIDHNDTVYVLGDFSYGYRGNLRELTDSLNGHKCMIPGNHDRNWMKDKMYSSAFMVLGQIEKITDMGRSVVLCHYPLCAYEQSIKGGFHVYGHVHNNINEPYYHLLKEMKRSFNAGVDVNDFTPRTLDELIERNKLL